MIHVLVSYARNGFTILLAAVSISTLSQKSNADPGRFDEIDPSSCGSFDTAIDWVTPMDKAVQKARRRKKLLLVMHLSGNFAKETFT